MAEVEIGRVNHYFDKIGVAVLALTGSIKVGDTLKFMGHDTDFQQAVTSMQIEHKPVTEAKAGEEVAMKVDKPVHANSKVFQVTA
jgi:selenocysteine-specific translation elongation factor